MILISAQSMLTVPIWVESTHRLVDHARGAQNALTLAGVATLVLAGTGLLAFFGVQVVVGIVLVPVTLLLARAGVRVASGVRRELLVRLMARRSRSPSHSP